MASRSSLFIGLCDEFEAEHGRKPTTSEVLIIYDETIAAMTRGPGRPRLGKDPAVVLSVTLPEPLRAELVAAAGSNGVSVSAAVREAVEVWIGACKGGRR